MPSAAFVQRLRERLTGSAQRRPAWLAWRVPRRVLMQGLGGAAAVFAVAMFGEQAVQRLPGQPRVPDGWVPVARAADLPPGTVKRFVAQDVEGHIMNIGGSIWALSAICTHMACVLSWQAADQTFLCPCHGAQFGMDGQQVGDYSYGISLPPLRRIPVQQMNGRLYVVLNDQG